VRRRHVAAMALSGLGALGAAAVMATPVTASSPQRSGWWNLAPLGLVLSPSPTQSGRLEVGQETGSRSAVAALWYSVAASDVPDPASVAATLTVPYESSSSVGTPSVLACAIPSSAAGWKAGDNQPGNSAPAYDCSTGHSAAGQLASDSSSMTFKLGPAQLDQKDMAFDVALVPTGTAPFQAEFDVPGSSGFVVQPPTTAPVASSGAASATTGTTGNTGGSEATVGSGADSAAGGTAASPLPAGNPAPDLSGGGGFPAQASPPAPGGPAATSPARGGRTPVAAAAGGASRPAPGGGPGWLGGRRQQLLGVWLMADVVLVLYLFASDAERAPRLLGSMAARRRERGATPVEETLETVGDQEVRGIGRFARPRSGPPRALT